MKNFKKMAIAEQEAIPESDQGGEAGRKFIKDILSLQVDLRN